MELHIVHNAVGLQPLAQGIDERLVQRTATAANSQFQILRSLSALQQNERLDQSVQSFLTAHAGKIAQDGNCPLSVVRCLLQLTTVH